MSIETLRHYDKKGVFHPAKRGEALAHKYRYYSPTQITAIKMTRVLADIGVPLQTVKELTLSRTPEKLLKLLNRHKDIVMDELRFLQEVYSVIHTFTELLHSGISAIENEICVTEMPEMNIILGDENEFDGSVSFYGEYTRFCNTLYEPKLNLSRPIGGYWESMEVFVDHPLPTRFFSIDPHGYQRREAGLFIVGYERGYYSHTSDLTRRMTAFAKKNGLLFNGPVYNIYLFDELSVTDPEQYLLQASASVRETRRAPSRRPARR
jgi:DNA-binding transcriptional MerR regulator